MQNKNRKGRSKEVASQQVQVEAKSGALPQSEKRCWYSEVGLMSNFLSKKSKLAWAEDDRSSISNKSEETRFRGCCFASRKIKTILPEQNQITRMTFSFFEKKKKKKAGPCQNKRLNIQTSILFSRQTNHLHNAENWFHQTWSIHRAKSENPGSKWKSFFFKPTSDRANNSHLFLHKNHSEVQHENFSRLVNKITPKDMPSNAIQSSQNVKKHHVSDSSNMFSS